ncbi:serine protease family S33, partial [Thraustotheca clavata]
MLKPIALIITCLLSSSALTIDGWFNCSASTLSTTNVRGIALSPFVECALVLLPLCHPKICSDTDNRQVEVFVKRIQSQSNDAQVIQDLWVLQGGPGASSLAMETMMFDMFELLNRQVNIYTMDHRGTGRSNPLECIASQATTPGSPGGVVIEFSEIPACVDDILFHIGGHTSAFSVTSAALDLKALLEEFGTPKNHEVYVYGASYGTLLVERLMQLEPTIVKGYTLDGVISQSGSNYFRHSFANWDHDVSVVGWRFLDRCMHDSYCHSQIPYNLTSLLRVVYDRVDKGNVYPGALPALKGRPPSHYLRIFLAKMLLNWNTRRLLPALIYRLWRASPTDYQVLLHIQSTMLDWHIAGITDSTKGFSMMLYYLIVFSEEWIYPTPTYADLKTEFEQGLFGDGVHAYVPYYCALTQNQDAACKDLQPKLNSSKFTYSHDEYWNRTTVIPPNASVLLLTGEFDAQTEGHYAVAELHNLIGTKKRLISFLDATHCAAFSTPMLHDRGHCGVHVIASYIKANGDLDGISLACMNDMQPLSFLIEPTFSIQYFGTEDAYGNAINSEPVLLKAPKLGEHLTHSLGATILVIIGVILCV